MLFFGTSGCLQLTYFCYLCLVSCTIATLKGYGRFLEQPPGNREFIYARVLREPSNSKDKWITFMAMLLESWQTQSHFPYTVELKLRDGEVYGSVSFEIPTPEVKYTKENGVIAIDTNALPIHLAVAGVSKTGELVSYQTVSLHHLLGLSQNSKDHQEWILAH